MQEESISKWHGYDEIPLENGECVENWMFAWVLTIEKEQVLIRPEIVKFNPYTHEWLDPANQVVFV
ncbi:hypothetical protein [Wielerella bovis]|uniref:hypothetical protein n=1 Tax=Wielerella bovis TaxID=2917790 RepID=UPI002019F1F0|nr:hypothetical protein [Wielerella bovis]MCG7657168.1 hypothetical protein [Wielerella bovis]MCG7659391.1 hypothetical protein [Wielerella bovis]